MFKCVRVYSHVIRNLSVNRFFIYCDFFTRGQSVNQMICLNNFAFFVIVVATIVVTLIVIRLDELRRRQYQKMLRLIEAVKKDKDEEIAERINYQSKIN